ncbi:MAG: response regulator [Lewinellaceae bacterium]|nr:response regulator [Lewinellaceae bacterium]
MRQINQLEKLQFLRQDLTSFCRIGAMLLGIAIMPGRLLASQQDTTTIEEVLGRAEQLLISYKNDSALVLAQQLATQVRQQGLWETPLGFRVRLAEATALQQDDKDDAALMRLLPLQEACRKAGEWRTYTRSCLVLALLYELFDRDPFCWDNLQQAKKTIARERLDELYPGYAVRQASYYRVFQNNRDSAVYYAREALRTAPQFALVLEEAVGHMLMGMLTQGTDPAEALRHYREALPLYWQLEDYTGVSYMYTGIARQYFRQQQYTLALLYNDSMIQMANQAITLGNDRHHTIARAYQFRGNIFRALGQQDSAWDNLNKGFQLERNDLTTSLNQSVAQIDAQYKDNQRLQQLAEEKSRRRLFAWLAFLAALSAAVLGYAYWRLRGAISQIQAQAAQLRAMDTVKSRFFANVSHELRTPLALITGPIRAVMKNKAIPANERALLEIADRSGDQLQQLIDDIMALEKLDQSQLQLQPQPTALLPFFRQQLAQFESLGHFQEIQFLTTLTIPPDMVADLDQEKCRQILVNLLANAFRYTPANGKIQVTIALVDQELQLTVADSGSGISAADLPYVFDRFFQTNDPAKATEGGTGIGLSLCKEYVELFGGTIEVESTLGVGARFFVRFPVQEGVPLVEKQVAEPVFIPVQAIQRRAQTIAGRDSPTLLLVEDNPDMQEYLKVILESRYQLVTAENGRAALDYLMPDPTQPDFISPCDLIISDLMMPVMDGFQLLNQLKAAKSTQLIPVIMLTARADAADKLKALRIGVDDYLLKPFAEEELLVRIANLLHNRAQRQEELEPLPAADPEAATAFDADQQWLIVFEDYLRQRLTDSTLTIPLLATAFSLSESSLRRQLKQLTGLTPNAYLQEMRLQEARRLLESPAAPSVGEAAALVGYADLRSFSRLFRKRFGTLPSAYLKKEVGVDHFPRELVGQMSSDSGLATLLAGVFRLRPGLPPNDLQIPLTVHRSLLTASRSLPTLLAGVFRLRPGLPPNDLQTPLTANRSLFTVYPIFGHFDGNNLFQGVKLTELTY